MASFSKTIICGNLGKDPEVRTTQSGVKVATLSVATNEKWKDKDGNMQEAVEWHRVVVWDKTADLCEKYLAKGRQVLVEGQNQTRKWTDKDGVERWTTEIKATRVVFLCGDATGKSSRPPHPTARDDHFAPGGEPVGGSKGNGDDDSFPF